ncbi:hypothetical protein [Limosilactobacillus gorillae]|uniref:hypothetical protein n=1 Tax=Limosilactobacillus gorillae TaxID=1450649 RepID=UPI000AB04E34|nr:hypothetical protein [Limosilactobacillus gorillae]
MRFDSIVKFYTNATSARYVPGKGYDSTVKLVGDLPANVTDVGIHRSVSDFGKITTGNKIIRTMEPVGKDWDYCLIDDDQHKYIPVTDRSPLKLTTYLVGRSQS